MSISARDNHSMTSGFDPVLDDVIEEIANKIQAGEPVDGEAILAKYPGRADSIRRLLPAMEVMAEFGVSASRLAANGVSPALSPLTGELGTLGDFRILREVGRGGMGIVYEAEQMSLSRRVALKVLPFAGAMDSNQLRRFRTEAQAAAQLHHTNIVPVFWIGCEQGVHYYAMQFIEGRTLADVIRELRQLEGKGQQDDSAGKDEARKAPAASALASALTQEFQPSEGWDGGPAPDAALAYSPPVGSDGLPSITPPVGRESPGARRVAAAPPTEGRPVPGPPSSPSTRNRAYFRNVARLGVEAAEALEHAHQEGIVHRDIKPANLMIDARGHLWVTDFGLARLKNDSGLTVTGDLLGTLRYMSPEQALGRRAYLDHRTDIYSLGVTLYELLTLDPAFGSRDRAELLRQIAELEPRAPRKLNESIPRELETIVLKAMAKEPASRYATAQDLADDLRRFLEHKPIHARRPGVAERVVKWSRRHAAWVIAAATVLSLAVVGLTIGTALIASKQTEIVRQRNEAQRQGKRARRIVDEMYTRLSERWLAQDPGDAELRREFLDKAAAYYEEFACAPVSDPSARREAAHAWLRAGNIAWTLNRIPEAEAAFRLAIDHFATLADEVPSDDLEPRDGQVRSLTRLGDLLALAGRNSEADTFFRRALDLSLRIVSEHPDHLGGWLNLADAQFSLGDLLDDDALFHDAESTRRRMISDVLGGQADVRPLVEQLLNHRTVAHLHYASWMARAIEKGADAREAILTDLYFSLGITLSKLGRSSGAVNCLQQAVRFPNQVRPARAYLLKNLAGELYLAARYREAISAYRESLDLVPNDPGTFGSLAYRLADCPDLHIRDPREAIHLARRSVDLAPDSGHNWQSLGVAYYRADMWPDAASALERAMAPRGGGELTDKLFMAMTQWRMGRSDLARSWYQRALADMAPSDGADHQRTRDPLTDRHLAEVEGLLGVSTPTKIRNQEGTAKKPK